MVMYGQKYTYHLLFHAWWDLFARAEYNGFKWRNKEESESFLRSFCFYYDEIARGGFTLIKVLLFNASFIKLYWVILGIGPGVIYSMYKFSVPINF